MQEIELVAQAGTLLAGEMARDVASGLDACVAIGWLDDADRSALLQAHGLCWQVLQVSRLLDARSLDPERIGEGGAAFVLRETGHDDIASLHAALQQATDRAAGVIDAALARRPGEATDGD